MLEGRLMQNILADAKSKDIIVRNFLDFRSRYSKYHIWFGVCELLNILMVLFSMWVTDMLLYNKFWNYGTLVCNITDFPSDGYESIPIYPIISNKNHSAG